MSNIKNVIQENKFIGFLFILIIGMIIYGNFLNKPVSQIQINKDISWMNSFIDNIHQKQEVLINNFNIDTVMQQNMLPLTSGFIISKNTNSNLDHFVSLSNTHIFMNHKNNIFSLEITSMSKNVCQNFASQLQKTYGKNVLLNNKITNSNNCSYFGNSLSIII